ncbi:NUDIX domain-containing protein [Nordella sp. HKS 07]|uniref:NUDIX hydrolase n=1 Tax=Nordella sp. HKS 07 TaxID=2712222 RepID=UPI0013E0F4BC|nr:NUDIX domain-containing protein [Nordella sp. HKS 07]QIG48943.1 NUDIX domain-containing protein [Nordella sp. HKS 07]
MTTPQDSPICIAAAIIFNEAGHVLVVRKRGASVFMQPGGKIEPDETPVAALRRELREEIALTIGEDAPVYIGRFMAEAAHEADRVVVADVFEVPLTGAVAAAAEIEEIRWVDPFALDLPLAVLSRAHIMPVARSRKGNLR